MSETREWSDEEWQLDQAVMDAEEVRPSGQVARLRAIREEWPKLRATVAALTAENERLRERLRLVDRIAAGLPSSRETTDGRTDPS